MKNKKVIIIAVGIAVVVGSSAFYGGLKYGEQSRNYGEKNIFGPFGQGQRTMMNRTGMRTGNTVGGFVGGTIVSKDATSMTISMRDGSSKIVFFTTATPVMKMVAGEASDLVIGKEVTITGTPNSDGSISADSIQMRPATSAPVQMKN